MNNHFSEAYRILKNNGYYVFVIGNSQTANELLPVHDCLIRLAVDSGFILLKAFGLRIRRHYMKFPRKGRGGIIVMDWIIVLKKSNSSQMNFYPPRLPLPWFTLDEDQVAH
jgi:hypothetical protein